MPSPFPGMDPWLEHPALWPGVHQRLITYACDDLQSRVAPDYFVEIGERVYVEGADRAMYPDVAIVESRQAKARSSATTLAADPCTVVRLQDVEIRQPYLEIREARAGKRVVTVIEILSPANKRPGAGRELYVQKQSEVLASDANLVEIDLLRAGELTVALPAALAPPTPYRVVVGRTRDRKARDVYPVGLRHRLPRVGIPLLEPDADVVLDLPAVFAQAYEKGAYERRIDYRDDPLPPLTGDDAAWARERTGKS